MLNEHIESIEEEVQGRNILKLAMILNSVPAVAATYSSKGIRLHHENIVGVEESALSQYLLRLDIRAKQKTVGKELFMPGL